MKTVVLALIVAPLVVRRIWPIPVFGVVVAGAIGAVLWDRHLVIELALLIALYTVAALRSRRAALVCAGLLEIVVVVLLVRRACRQNRGPRWLLAVDRSDSVMLKDALLDVVDRPEQLDEPRLERALGRFLARYVAAGIPPDVRMFTDLFRIVANYGLAVLPEIAAVFRALATMEGTLSQLAPGFDIVAEARRFSENQLAAQLSPDVIRKTAADELVTLMPMLRRLPRRIDRIGSALEEGRLTVRVRLLADPSDRRYLTGLVHRGLLAFLGAAAGIIAVLMIGLRGGPALSKTVSLYCFFGYCLLVIAAILAVRVLVQVFRADSG